MRSDPSLHTMYAIRHKPSGHFLPNPKGKIGRGGSFVHPVEPMEGDLTTYPRLFVTKRGAQCCLTQWLRGEHHAVIEYETDDWGRSYHYTAGADVKPQADRIREDMEVVTIDIMPR